MRPTRIEHRALKNTAVGTLSFFVTLGQTVLLVPILLKYWGSTTYGVWLTLMAGFSLLQSLDVGHQNYVGNRLIFQYHIDASEFRRTLGSGVLMAWFLGITEMAVCVLLITTGTLPRLLDIPVGQHEQHVALGLLVLMTMWVAFGSVGGVIVRIMIPAGMLYESQWLAMGMRLSQFLSVMIVAFLGGSILSACVAYALAQSVASLLVLHYVRRKLPQFYPWWRAAHWHDGFKALQKSVVLTFNSVGQQLSNNGLVLLVSILFAAAVVPVFTTLRTLTNTAVAMTTIFASAVFPDMIRFRATSQAERLADVFGSNWFVSGAIVNYGILLVLPIAEPMYRIWTNEQLPFDAPLFLLLAAAVSFTNFGAGLLMYLQGINDLRSQTVITIARGGLVFAVAYGLSGPLGIRSIGVGCLVAEIVASLALPLLFVNRSLAGWSPRLDGRHAAIAAAPPVLLTVACTGMIFYRMDVGVLTLVLIGAFTAVYYLHWRRLSPEVRARVRSLVPFRAERDRGMISADTRTLSRGGAVGDESGSPP